MRPFFYVLTLLTGVLAAGCGPSYTVTPAEGVLQQNGKPLENILVTFMPDSTKKQEGPHSSGITDAQGRFVLKTPNGQVGAVVGWHVVTLEDVNVDRPPQGRPQKNPSRITGNYHSAGTTPIKIEVKADSKDYELEIAGSKKN